jgi:radical SAM superfamily enzyme YgiQ (UPF0313 family)
VLLISCYELGRQPFNIASPWAQLDAAGFAVDGVDTAIDELTDEQLSRARLVAISVPMHTALRLGLEIAARARRVARHAHVCFFGLYASLNAELILAEHGDSVIGGEFEEALVMLASALARGDDGRLREHVPGVVHRREQLSRATRTAPAVLRKLPFVVPRRDKLAPLSRYATFFGPEPHEIRKVGYVEASRGCLHRCRHCPVTPVYEGRFFVVPQEIVVGDAEQQIAAGARHITFGDPDFFNGPRHGLAVLAELHRRHPEVSFDVTIKIEHLLAYRDRLPELRNSGVVMVVSAVESLSDSVLAKLRKGHTRADVIEALALCRAAGVVVRPSLVAFTPWTSLDDYVELVEWIAREDLVDHIEPIQLAIRLLLPPGSALLAGAEERPWLGALDEAGLGYNWAHPDRRMDLLYRAVSSAVADGQDADAGAVFSRIRELAYGARGEVAPAVTLTRRFVPRLSEAWFCCAEPTAQQLAAIAHLPR